MREQRSAQSSPNELDPSTQPRAVWRGGLPHAARSFVGPDRVTWIVYEIPGATVPGARGDTCLVFDGGTTLRRVWKFPRNWRELSATELFELSWAR